MTCAHNYAQCCDGVGGEKAWSTLAASASGGETVGCVVLLHWATLGWNRTMLLYRCVVATLLSILHTPWWLYDAVVNVSNYVCM